MKIASYNLWDCPAGMPHRRGQIASALSSLHADILCIQETLSDTDFPSLLPDLPFCACHEDAGLTTLSRYPIKDSLCMPYALIITVSYGTQSLCVINVHLPWKSALLAGDFNCSDASSVHRFMCGEQSLLGHDAYFFDLAIAYSAQTDIPPEPTLDFRQNPRWGVIDPPNTLEKNERFDRIYLANPYPGPAPILREFGVFGKEISAETRLAPSDHYGVYAFLDLS